MEEIQNKVMDSTELFPENQQFFRNGISVEFRNVSFQYPGRDKCALRDVSLKIEAGQFCVVVGVNGSGKSTILKLISRIYDPIGGTTLIDNRDIKTFRLADLRAAVFIPFQDYSQDPLSTLMRENIGLGNPALAHDNDKKTYDSIDELPDGFHTYLDRHTAVYYGDLPEGTTMLFGSPSTLLILIRFMTSICICLQSSKSSSAGMLLFNEPSTSLDPTAEYDLFERLRNLRGNKTMIFSTHRFGNLTQHPDLIFVCSNTNAH
ncbi:P-loop containing nucleoside triphosphate hydrolase protein [Suillus spraguei]|nr:P-loop containing nucleoside triphosphate hydrolase protein [Suillus spraguei]